MVKDGSIRTHVCDSYSLEDAISGMALMDSGRARGKILIDIAGIFHVHYKKYLALVKAVHRHIIEGYAIHRALLEKAEKAQEVD